MTDVPGFNRGSDVLAYTVTFGDRPYLSKLVPAMRAHAGMWFDWAVFVGAPSSALLEEARALVNHPQQRGIQFLMGWSENRGQHHATKKALEFAKEHGYKWLVRIDDDVKPKTKRFLKHMIDRLEQLKAASGDPLYRLVASPKVVGLENRLTPIDAIRIPGLKFDTEVMEFLGGAFRVHNVEFFSDYKPPLYAPIGRGDPGSIMEYVTGHEGLLVRFPDIRVVHRTKEIEADDTEADKLRRTMSSYWPYLGPDDLLALTEQR